MKKSKANLIKSVLETHLGEKYTKTGFRRAKRAYMKLSAKQRSQVG